MPGISERADYLARHRQTTGGHATVEHMTRSSRFSSSSPLGSASATRDTAIRRLRLVLRANATTSFAGGAVALLAGPWVSRELGIDHVFLTRAIGAGLIAFAIHVVLASRSKETSMLRDALLISLADATWVLASIAVVASGVLTTTGNLVIALVAIGVGDFGIAQFLLRAQAVREPRPNFAPATA